jgi:hypothetical protein
MRSASVPKKREPTMRLSLAVRFAVIGFGLLVAPPLYAQKEEASEGKEGEEKSEETSTEGEGEKAEDEKAEGDGRPVEPEEQRTNTSPVEHKGETYRFVGLRYRALLIPTFIMEMFGQGGETIVVHNFGPEFTIRKDDFEYSFALTYAPYSMGDGPTSENQVAFKAPDDPEIAWEVVTSEIKIVYLTADFLWSQPISKQVSFIYGGGAGIGIVFGDLYRTQAYLGPDGKYLPCDGPPGMGTPANQVEYCAPEPDDEPTQHYPGYKEPSWADGGSKPIIFPWIAIQAGIRWKPHRNFVTRFEAGVGLGQFFLGVGADYGL